MKANRNYFFGGEKIYRDILVIEEKDHPPLYPGIISTPSPFSVIALNYPLREI